MQKLSRRTTLRAAGAGFAMLPLGRLLACTTPDSADEPAEGEGEAAEGEGEAAEGEGEGEEPIVEPAWLVAQPAGTWLEIAGAAGVPGGLNMNAFCDMTIRQRDCRLLAAASGGHSDGASNAAAALDLLSDTPTWTLLRESTWDGVEVNVNYYADGSPCSRHTYHHTHYIESLDAILLAGCRYGWGGGTPTHGGMDLFDLATNAYLPRGTWPDSPGAYGVALDGEGNVWNQAGEKFDVVTKTWSKPGSGSLLRYPAAFDSVRNRIFALQFADGEGYNDPVLNARELDPATGNSVEISFNPSDALTQFNADAPAYAAMAFCPVDGRFYFMHPGRMGTFYVVTPNASAVWDMALWTPAGTAPPTSGVLCKRLLWVERLAGFVLQGDQNQNLRFVRGSAPPT